MCIPAAKSKLLLCCRKSWPVTGFRCRWTVRRLPLWQPLAGCSTMRRSWHRLSELRRRRRCLAAPCAGSICLQPRCAATAECWRPAKRAYTGRLHAPFGRCLACAAGLPRADCHPPHAAALGHCPAGLTPRQAAPGRASGVGGALMVPHLGQAACAAEQSCRAGLV